MSTGDLIRAARKKAGLTQRQLGELCGIAEPTIRRYELGKLNPKRETLQKIAKPLGVRWYELYSDNIDTQIDMIDKEIEADIHSVNKDSNEFTRLLTHPVIEDLARALVDRNQEIVEIKAQQEGRKVLKMTEEDRNLDARWKIVNALLKNKIYPTSYKSLMDMGFTKGEAFSIMKISKSDISEEELTQEQIENDDTIASVLTFCDFLKDRLGITDMDCLEIDDED